MYHSSDTDFSQFMPIYMSKNLENAPAQAMTQLPHCPVSIKTVVETAFRLHSKTHFSQNSFDTLDLSCSVYAV